MIDDIERGRPCPHWAHARHADSVARDPASGACLSCLAQVAEGRMTFDTSEINPIWRGRYLEFWSLVDIRSPRECWDWQGIKSGKTRPQTRFYLGKQGRHKGAVHVSPQRAAFIFSWGDIGTHPVDNTCHNPRCCNPLHLRARGVPHLVGPIATNERELLPLAHRVSGQSEAFLEACKEHSPRRFKRLQQQSAGDWLA